MPSLVAWFQYDVPQFKFFNAEEDRACLIDEENALVPDDVLHAHMDPFYNECRAYGRLVESDNNGNIAVRCYGHLSIAAEKEEEFGRRFEIGDWNRPDEDDVRLVSTRQPFRAIVKEMIQEDAPLNSKKVKKMLKDLKRLRKLGIYPMDVRARNYRAGLLVDLSLAMTTPHYLFKIRPRWQIRSIQREDLLMFDQMIKDEKIATWERALPNKEYCSKLRSRSKKEASRT